MGEGETLLPHPRIRQRREEILREEDRRRKHRYLWIAAPVLLIGVLFGLAHTPVFAVASVTVEGADRTGGDAVVAAAGIDLGGPMLTLDERGIERRVRALPWVDRVDVVRDWPGDVRIVVTERSPAAAVMAEGSNIVAWVDAGGRVLHLAPEAPPGLVLVTGVSEIPPEGEDLPAGARDALRYAVAAPERVPDVLGSISTDLVGEIRNGVPGEGAAVHFRTVEAVEEKLVALDTVLSGADLTCLAKVDLWVPDNPTLTRHPDCG